ncbi:MAG: hypothetical protein JKY56_08625 [Kofleriaceae bacterium]|nr:hypothetical protein [Kofleriaceae bacterium]
MNLPDKLDCSPPPCRVHARGTDVIFALAVDVEVAMSIAKALDEAIDRGVRLFDEEMSLQMEKTFFSRNASFGQ